MGYVYYIVNHHACEAFYMDKHWNGWPHDRKDVFETPEKLLEAIIVATRESWALWHQEMTPQKTATWALALRDRIWRWKGDSPGDKIEFMGEDGYYDMPKIWPATGNCFDDRASG
jgi:hypothetical protein